MTWSLKNLWDRHRRWLAIPIASLMATTVFHFTHLAPMRLEYAQQVERNATLETALQERRTAITGNDELRSSVEALEDAVFQARIAVPEGPTTARLLNFLNITQVDTLTQLVSLDHLETMAHPEAELTETQYALTATGAFNDIVRLLETIERQAPYLLLDRVDFRRVLSGDRPEVELRTELRALGRPDALLLDGVAATPLPTGLQGRSAAGATRQQYAALSFGAHTPLQLHLNDSLRVDPFRPLGRGNRPRSPVGLGRQGIHPRSLPLEVPSLPTQSAPMGTPLRPVRLREPKLVPLPAPIPHVQVATIIMGAERLALLHYGQSGFPVIVREGDWLPASNTRIHAISPTSVLLTRGGEVLSAPPTQPQLSGGW